MAGDSREWSLMQRVAFKKEANFFSVILNNFVRLVGLALRVVLVVTANRELRFLRIYELHFSAQLQTEAKI